ncbi:MAG TPA: DUF177 domain-containing protein [Longimicrobiales bacterium]
MLKVDLGLLKRRGRITVDEDLPSDHPLWEETGIRPHGSLAVRLEAQSVGSDVWVRGRLDGRAVLECRRCLVEVVVPVGEPVSLLYRAGVEPAEAEREEVYALPARARELDLTAAIREHLLLAVPRFALCQEACRGLCARCGRNLNEGECECASAEMDERWAALKRLKED